MGEASRRKKEGRGPKDPLRFRRANLERWTREESMFAAAYHRAKELREAEEKAIAEAEEKLKANGHPLYQDAPETAQAATDSGGEDGLHGSAEGNHDV